MKKELSLEEWKELGKKTKDIRDNLIDLQHLLKDKLTTDQYFTEWKAAEKAFTKLRSHLDGIVCGYFQDKPDGEITGIFFGIDEKK